MSSYFVAPSVYICIYHSTNLYLNIKNSQSTLPAGTSEAFLLESLFVSGFTVSWFKLQLQALLAVLYKVHKTMFCQKTCHISESEFLCCLDRTHWKRQRGMNKIEISKRKYNLECISIHYIRNWAQWDTQLLTLILQSVQLNQCRWSRKVHASTHSPGPNIMQQVLQTRQLYTVSHLSPPYCMILRSVS